MWQEPEVSTYYQENSTISLLGSNFQLQPLLYYSWAPAECSSLSTTCQALHFFFLFCTFSMNEGVFCVCFVWLKWSIDCISIALFHSIEHSKGFTVFLNITFTHGWQRLAEVHWEKFGVHLLAQRHLESVRAQTCKLLVAKRHLCLIRHHQLRKWRHRCL